MAARDVVQINYGSGTGGAAAAVSITVTAGNALVAVCHDYNSPPTPGTLSDDKGNTWNRTVPANEYIYGIANNCAGGFTTVTFAGTSGRTCDIMLFEIEAGGLSISIEEYSLEGGSGTSYALATDLTPSQQATLLGTVWVYNQTLQYPSGWTSGVSVADGDQYFVKSAYQNNIAAGSYDFAGSIDSSTIFWFTQCLVIIGTGGGGGTTWPGYQSPFGWR